MSTKELFNIPLNIQKCYASIKSKNTHYIWRQCHNKHKHDQIYCGIHLKAKNPKRYDLISDLNLKKSLVTLSIKKSQKSVDMSSPKTKRLCTNTEKLELNFRNTSIIVKIQSFVRMYLIKKRYNCVNQVDFYTQDLLIKIPSPYFITLCDETTNIKYGFDLRSLKRLLQDNKINPFTIKEFSPSMLIKAFDIIKKTEKYGYLCDIEKDKLSNEQEYRNLVLMVFQKINFLGNYTDDNWYLELDMKLLKKLYIEAEDIWNYRTELPFYEKCKIVKYGKLFVEINRVKTMKPDQQRELSIMIIKEFDRMVSEGINNEYKKLGAMLALTALTEVSTKAAEAMPMYVQNYVESE